MAGNSIGNAALLLSASGGQLKSDLTAHGSFITGWAGKLTGKIGSTISGITSRMTTAVSGGGLSAFAMGGPIGVGLGVITAAVSGAIDRLGSFSRVARDATSLGIDTTQYQGLQAVLEKAGIGAEQAQSFFASLGKTVTDASRGMGRAGPILESLGLNARNLARLPIDEQFLSIADAISKLKTPAEQAQAAMRLGIDASLLPQLQRGREGIQTFIDGLRASGAILSGDQMAQAQDAAKAWKEASVQLKNSWTGISNRMTIAFAPLVSMLAKVFAKIFDFVSPIFGVIGGVISAVSEVIMDIFGAIGDSIKGAVDTVSDWIKAFQMLSRGSMSTRDVVIMCFRAVGVAGAYVIDTLKAGFGAVTFAMSYLVQGIGFVIDAFSRLTALARHIPDAVRPEWVNSFTDGVDAARDSVNNAAQGMRNWGAASVAEFGGAARTVNGFFDRIQRRQQQVAQQQRRLANGMPAGDNPAKFQLIKAVTFGSDEDVEGRQLRNWQARNPGLAQVQGIERQQLNELQGIRRGIENMNQREQLELEAV